MNFEPEGLHDRARGLAAGMVVGFTVVLSQQADMQSVAEPSQAKLPKISVELARLSKKTTIGASTLLSDRLLGHGSSPPS